MNSDFTVAVHALVYLSHRGCTLSSEQLAENICTNPVRVRKILSKLVKAGLVQPREGAEGGYRLARSAEDIPLSVVSDALGLAFVASSWHSGSPEMECLIASGMAGLMDRLYGELNELCRSHLSQRTIKDLEREIFSPSQQPN